MTLERSPIGLWLLLSTVWASGVALVVVPFSPSALVAQGVVCTVPVNVVTPSLAGLSKSQKERIAVKWKEHTEHGRGLVPKTSSNWAYQADGFVPWLEAFVHANWNPIYGLPADAFVARSGKLPVRIESGTTNSGPRRVVFVVEDGKRVTAGARKVESAVISYILSAARPEDSFALLTACGPRIELPFGSSREAIQQAAKRLAQRPTGIPARGGVLDAVLEAVRLFRRPQPGDSIFLITMRVQGRNRATFSQVRSALLANEIRVFALQVGWYRLLIENPSGTAGEGVSYFVKSFALSGISGGMAAVRWSWGGFDALEIRGFERQAGSMYKAICKYYALQLDRRGKRLVVGLAPAVRNRYPLARVLYPRHAPSCSR